MIRPKPSPPKTISPHKVQIIGWWIMLTIVVLNGIGLLVWAVYRFTQL